MSTGNQDKNDENSPYSEDDIENYIIYEEDSGEDEDWDWDDEEEDDEEIYVYVDEEGNIIEEDDEDYPHNDTEYYDEESEMNELIGIVSGNASKTNESGDLSDLESNYDKEFDSEDKSAQIEDSRNTNNISAESPMEENNDNDSNNHKKLNFNIKQKISDLSDKIDADEILEPYDSFIGKILGMFSKIPLIGKVFIRLGEKKTLSRLSPIIIVVFILGILFGISFITEPSKTSTIPLPDMGEITVTSKEFNNDEESMNVIISNTGDVIIPANATLSLYTYNPTLNPLTIIGFEKIGECEISEIIIDLENEEEHSLPCNFIEDNTQENIKYRTVVSYEEDSEE